MPLKRIPPEAGELFLAGLARGCSVAMAAKHAGVSRQTAYNWRTNPAFLKRWIDAVEAATDLLEDEARRRAVEGVDKPIYRGGQVVGNVKDLSDRLLMTLLSARRPEIFQSTRKSEPAGRNDGEFEGARASLDRKLARLARAATPASLPEKPH